MSPRFLRWAAADRDPSRLLLTRVLPLVAALIAAFGLLRWEAEARGWIGTRTGIALMAGLAILLCAAVLRGAAVLLRAVGDRHAHDRNAIYRELGRSLSGGGIFVFDHALRYVAVGSDGLDALGLTEERLEGRTIWEVYPREEAAMLESMYRAALAGEERALEVPFRDQVYRVQVLPLRDDGEIVGGVVISERVTEERQLEQQLYQAQKMDAVGRLAGGVAHDFNNLLFAMRGFAELTQRHPDRAADYSAEIVKAADRGAALTRQLLAFSRQQVVQAEPIDLNALVRDTAQLLGRLIGEDVAITENLEDELGTVLADAGQLSQVLVNLAVNARDAMPGGGQLTIETHNVDLSDRWVGTLGDLEPGHYVRLTVTDTGCGMDKETVEHVFEPFFTTKPVGQGTGLGLATVYGIVRQSRGAVHVYSEPGRGTSFSVYLPRVRERAQAASGPRERGLDGGNERILLVEDEPVVRSLLGAMLRDRGYEVVEAEDGEAALELAATGEFDLLVSDFVLSKMNGPDLASRLRARRPELRTLFMSGYTSHTMLDEARLDCDFPFLQKPFSGDTLAAKIREVLE
jgi:PAS domain S-box-containing protein